MHIISSYRGNRPTHTHPQTGPITIHAPQCNYNRQQQHYVTVNHLQTSSPHPNTNNTKHLISTHTNAQLITQRCWSWLQELLQYTNTCIHQRCADTVFNIHILSVSVKDYPYLYSIRIVGSIMVQLHRESKKFPWHFRLYLQHWLSDFNSLKKKINKIKA